ncbi:MAG: pyridoxamine 5'-phosphate oxidase family protein [Synergistaceae bacterium]|jgi:general stress protein 26|nr:pyridoxamine 5'-phosphate oxidase family protein [Synergistaceae bacterium]
MKNGESAKKGAAKLLETMECVYMATNGENGHPNLRAMAAAKTEGVKTLWFVTDEESSKAQELLRDDKAVVYAGALDAGEVKLWGNVEILEDMASRKKVWSDEVAEHFPGGIASPNLRVLRFKVSNGIYADKKWQKHAFKN